MNTPKSKANDVYAREVVMARVGHLIRRKQQEVERITRILRACFDPDAVQAPEPGEIRRIILIGPYARKGWYEDDERSEEHTSELQSLMRISYAVFCLNKKKYTRSEKTTSKIQSLIPNHYTIIRMNKKHK